MEGLIKIKEHNEQVEKIDAKKRAIIEASELGVSTLEEKKPKPIQSISHGFNCIKPYVHSDKSYSPYAFIKISNTTLTTHGDYSHSSRKEVGVCKDDLVSIAACIIKAFGPIPQELIDSVVVE